MSDNGSQQLLAIGEVARLLELPVHVVRRWIDYHAAHLSETARPATSGTPRRLTQRDVEVLRAVKQLRSQSLTVAVINERLGSLKVGEIEPAPESTDLQPAQQSQPAQDATQTALMVVEAMQSALAPLAARIEALEQERHAQRLRVDAVFIFIAGLVIGLVVASAWAWFR